jgi:hypothetical protein
MILMARLAAAMTGVGWKVAPARQMLRVKNILGDIRSVTSVPVVRYAEKSARTNSVVSTAGGGAAMIDSTTTRKLMSRN